MRGAARSAWFHGVVTEPVPDAPVQTVPSAALSPAKGFLAVVSAFVLGQLLGGLGLIGAAALLLVIGEASVRDLSKEATLRALLLRPFTVGVSLVATQTALALTTYAFARMGKLRFGDAVGLRGGERRLRVLDVILSLLLVLAIGPLADAAAVLVARTFPGFTLGTIDMIGDLMRGDAVTAILIGLLVALAPAFAEEVLFRGLLLRALLARFGPAVAVVASSLLFGLIHVDPPQATGAALIGLALGFMTCRTGSLWPAMAAHAANNGAAVLLARYSDPKPMAQLAIDPWEVSTSVVVTLVLVAVIAVRTPRRVVNATD